MLESGHDSASALDYLRFGARLGFLGLLGLGRRFVSAILALVVRWREHFSDATRWVRNEHERKMALLAEARQISLLKLQALASLQRPPITRSLVRILAGVMLDRVAVAVAVVVALGWLIAARWTPMLGLQLGVAAALVVPLALLWRRARGAIDASDSLRERAARVAALFPAAFVVMGHTHLPEVGESADGTATYVNVGAWAEEETPDSSLGPPAWRTHLIVDHVEGRPRGMLMSWTEEQGPQHFVSTDRDDRRV
jgi:UDP-2,3-diacylglucosamine pyrophosphatase LpxH